VFVVAENFVCCPGVHYGQSGDAFLDAADLGVDAPAGPMRFPFEALVKRALDGLGEGLAGDGGECAGEAVGFGIRKEILVSY